MLVWGFPCLGHAQWWGICRGSRGFTARVLRSTHLHVHFCLFDGAWRLYSQILVYYIIIWLIQILFLLSKFLQKDVFVVSCDLITDVALHHLADIHRSHDSTLTAFLAPVPQTSADREAANNPKAKKKTDTSGIYLLLNTCFAAEVKY